MVIIKLEDVTKQGLCKILWRKLCQKTKRRKNFKFQIFPWKNATFATFLNWCFHRLKRQVFYLKKSLFRSEILFSVKLLDCSDAWALGPKFTDVGELVPKLVFRGSNLPFCLFPCTFLLALWILEFVYHVYISQIELISRACFSRARL